MMSEVILSSAMQHQKSSCTSVSTNRQNTLCFVKAYAQAAAPKKRLPKNLPACALPSWLTGQTERHGLSCRYSRSNQVRRSGGALPEVFLQCDDVSQTQVLMTLFTGKTVYQREEPGEFDPLNC